MRRHLVVLCALAAVILSCAPIVPPPVGSDNAPSKAFFAVPAALSGDPDGAKTVASDAWVTTAVGEYFEYVRGQVRFGSDIADNVRAFLENLEQMEYQDGFLLDSTVNATITDAEGTIRWTTVAAGQYLFEKWDASNNKLGELSFSRNGDRYWGTVILSGAVLPAPGAGNKNPDMLSITFDSVDPLAAGSGTLVIKATNFRAHPDLAWGVAGADESAAGQEDIIISLAKDMAGVVTLGSMARVTNSRHFVWNGYSYDGTLNTGATPETRYYCAAGASSAGFATVHLGIPATVGADVFSGYGVGGLVRQLFRDRLVNDYAFDSGTTTGHTIIAALNSLTEVTPKLDTAVYTNNDPAEVYTALTQAQVVLDGTGTGNEDWVDYLVSMMSVTNPVHFDSYHYDPAPGASYPALDDTAARALLPASGDVDLLAISFASSAAP